MKIKFSTLLITLILLIPKCVDAFYFKDIPIFLKLYENDTLSEKNNIPIIKYDNGKSAFPAAYVYDNIWSTTKPNPYPKSITYNDSILKITLISDSSQFSLPGEGRITSPYGWRDGKFHEGIDLDIYHGLPVHALFPGVVRMSKSFGGYGRLVIIRHDNGLETFYAHLGTIKVKAGQRINAGDIIGTCGNSGTSRGTHLHLEIRFKGESINPAHLISIEDHSLKYKTILLRKNDGHYFVYHEDALLYKIKRGDYLHKIANEFGTTVRKIRETNDIPKNGILRAGQYLSICL